MGWLRSTIGCIAVAWLLCHAAVALGTVVLAAESAHARIECTCVHGDHAVCPMHHERSANSTLCLLKSVGQDRAAIPTTLFMGIGLLPARPCPDQPAPLGVAHSAATRASSPRSSPPDPPPPRI